VPKSLTLNNLRIQNGHAWVYCHHCKKEVEVLVRANKQ